MGKRQLSFSVQPKHVYCAKTIDFNERFNIIIIGIVFTQVYHVIIYADNGHRHIVLFILNDRYRYWIFEKRNFSISNVQYYCDTRKLRNEVFARCALYYDGLGQLIMGKINSGRQDQTNQLRLNILDSVNRL